MADLPNKESAFFDWYNEVLERAAVTDKRYPVKGINVWTPFGFKALALLDTLLREKVEPLGYQEVNFPTLIPETELKKEGEHIKGFDEEVYWVTHGGKTELDVKLALRPTSETAMYPIFALWVRSHRDLPLKVFQLVNVFRYETKSTRPLIRMREFHFFEGHTVQLDDAGAEAQAKADLGSFKSISHELCLPYLLDRRPEWDKFPGAHYSMACDMPIGGNRTLQIGTVHHYMDNFAKAFGISYEDKDGNRRTPCQTTYGISERLLGGVIAAHGDGKGLVWPSRIAPIQAVIIPIHGEEDAAAMLARAEEIRGALQAASIRAVVDASDERPGAKYYAWELKGVPLRVEIGKREMKEGTLSLVNRLGGRQKVSGKDVAAEVKSALLTFDTSLLERAVDTFRKLVHMAIDRKSVEEGTVNVVGWCGAQACGLEVEKEKGLSILGQLEDLSILADPARVTPPCLICGKSPSIWAVAAKPL